MSSTDIFHTLFEYKAWANGELLDAIRGLDPMKYEAARHKAIRILNHTYVVDRIFAAHLTRHRHGYTATNTVETPVLDQLDAAIRESDRWFVGYAKETDRDALDEVLAFTFTDGMAGSMTREQILAHLITHGGYHRGEIGMHLASSASLQVPRDILSRYLHRANV